MTDDSLSGYLARGWALIALHAITPGGLCTCEPTRSGEPCASPGKHPLYENWQKIPILEMGVWQAIAGWRSRHGLGTNVGLATGVHSGVFALDHDPKNVTNPAAVAAFLAALPATWSQRTGSGGRHWLFAMPGDFAPTNARGTLPDGLDIRGNGGFIVLAPSVSGYGSYEVLTDGTPAAPPPHLLEAIRPAPYVPRATASSPTGTLEQIDARASAYAARALEGGLGELRAERSSRNERAFRVAARLHELINAGWLGYDETLDAYLEACETASRNKPEPFGQHEAMHVWENAERRAAGKMAELPASTLGGTALDFPGPRTEAPSSSGLSTTGQSTPSSPGFFAAPGEAPRTSSETSAGGSATGLDLNLPAEFWAARPVLKQLQMAAHSRLVSADVVLYSTLVRLAALWPHTVKLDNGIKDGASASLFAAVVGPSGAGKTSGVGVARSLLPRPHWLDREAFADDRPLGTGEGLAEVFMGQKAVPKLDENRQPMLDAHGAKKMEKIRAQVRHNALMHADEGEVIARLMERSGATIGETLRRAWTGGTLGQSNGRAETTRVVEAGEYSLGILVGFQPETAEPLLADVKPGSPQRFLWCWAIDPSIPDEPVPHPGPLRDVWPVESAPLPEGMTWVIGTTAPDLRRTSYSPAITAEIRRDLLSSARGETTPPELDSHRTLMLTKLSALLAYLDGSRRHVTDEDFALARVVYATSRRVQDHLMSMALVRSGKAAEDRRAAHSAQETQADQAKLDARDKREDAAVERVAAQASRSLRAAAEPLTPGGWRRRVAPRDRQRFAAAAALAVERQWVLLDADGRYSSGPVHI